MDLKTFLLLLAMSNALIGFLIYSDKKESPNELFSGLTIYSVLFTFVCFPKYGVILSKLVFGMGGYILCLWSIYMTMKSKEKDSKFLWLIWVGILLFGLGTFG